MSRRAKDTKIRFDRERRYLNILKDLLLEANEGRLDLTEDQRARIQNAVSNVAGGHWA